MILGKASAQINIDSILKAMPLGASTAFVGSVKGVTGIAVSLNTQYVPPDIKKLALSIFLDTVCIPRKDAIKALTRIEQGKADSAELVLRKDEIRDLMNLTDQQRTSIQNMSDRNVNQEFRIANLQEQNYATTKELKKVKGKAVVFKVAGIGVTAALTFALIFFK